MPTIQREVSDRTLFGKICKWLFVGFNVIMAVSLLSMCVSAPEAIQNASSSTDYPDAAAAGATIGAGIAVGSLLFLWLVGDVILGLFVLFTRRKKLVTYDGS